MARAERQIQDLRSLWVLLIVVGMLAGATITSCGGSSGGDSNGALCQQCGDTDGPCQPTFQVVPGPDQPAPCNAEGAANPCTIELICRRKSDSSQQRCFPKDPSSADVNYQYRCDGSRPGGTAVPVATPTLTPTPATTAVPQTCNNSIREGTEECDSIDLAGQSCESLCSAPGGFLSCRAIDCTFNFDNCLAGNAGCSP